MAATTDYDAPRRSTLEDEADTESLDALTAARADKQSPVVDLDEGDSGESAELPGGDPTTLFTHLRITTTQAAAA